MIAAIRIVSRPAGEAPEWVRDAWIGLVLATCGAARPVDARTVGVLTGPRSLWKALWLFISRRSARGRGYLVRVLPAIEQLDAANPPAAAWWREAAPHVLTRWGVFQFDEGCARPADER